MMMTAATGSNDQVVRKTSRGGVKCSFSSRVRYHYLAMAEIIGGIVWALAPTVLVGLLFWMILRSIIRADRSERKVYARMEAQERARRGMAPKP